MKTRILSICKREKYTIYFILLKNKPQNIVVFNKNDTFPSLEIIYLYLKGKINNCKFDKI